MVFVVVICLFFRESGMPRRFNMKSGIINLIVDDDNKSSNADTIGRSFFRVDMSSSTQVSIIM